MTIPTAAAAALGLAVLATLAGCTGSSGGVDGRDGPAVSSPPGSTATAFAADCPKVKGGGDGVNTLVDYVDFVQAFGRQYVAGLGRNVKPATRADLGQVLLRSRCSFSALNDRTHGRPGEPRDGDTGFLPPGTPIRALHGWPVHCRLAAVHDGRVVVYLAYLQDAVVAKPVGCAVRPGDGDRTEG